MAEPFSYIICKQTVYPSVAHLAQWLDLEKYIPHSFGKSHSKAHQEAEKFSNQAVTPLPIPNGPQNLSSEILDHQQPESQMKGYGQNLKSS